MNLFKLVGSVFIDNEEANKSISKTDSQAESLAQKFVKGATTAAKWGAGIATAAVGMATAVGGAMVKVANDTREYRNEIGKLETAFESSGYSATTAKNTYQELQSILGETDQSVEAANHLAKLCNTEEELSKWTNICTGVYATFGASLPIEGLTEAANETAKTGALTGGLADALNWAGVNEDEFQAKLDKCNTEQERTALITETLNGLYSETAETYRENNKEVIEANKAQERLNSAMAMVGETVEPVVSKIKNYGAELIEKVVPAISDFVTESETAEFVTGLVKDAVDLLQDGYSQLKEFITGVVDGWKDAVEWGEQHQNTVIAISGAFGTLAAAIVAYNVVQAIKNAGGIAELAQLALLQVQIWGLTAAETAHTVATTIATGATTAFGVAVAFLTSPITLTIAAIGALIAVGVLLYKNWDTVKAKCSELVSSAKQKFNEMRNDVSEKFNSIKTTAEAKVNSMKTSVVNKFNEIKNGISEKINGAKDTVKSAIEKIKGFFNFKWSLPKIKTPHFSVSGGEAPWGFGGKGSLPKVKVAWYNRALEKPMVLNNAEIFGYNAATGNLLGGGETKTEYITGEEALKLIVREAIRAEQTGKTEKLISLVESIFVWLANGGFEELLIDILTKRVRMKWETREIARLVREYA